ncbi:alveolar macrophage chemotactic factor-like isoform X2 [Phyllobates terribilis]|uniref:alveolar macrophage chemotactic factor-like isoform X2 n=1 Tax=Phyllobates terribilis TaxID=111132 RepID=UPI003CCAD637
MKCKVLSSEFVILVQLSALLFICCGITGAAKADLRCQCIKSATLSKPIKKIQVMDMQLISSGPHCSRVELIVTFKNGNKDCLNPEVKWVKRMIKKMLRKRTSRTK